MRVRSAAVVAVLALLGLVLAAGITLAASSLTSQHVGLSGEPANAGDTLVPRLASTIPEPKHSRTAHTATTPATTKTPTVSTDDRGRGDGSDDGGGRGAGRGGGDD